MPFGFTFRSAKLSNAIAKAYSKKVIMFAAASNGSGTRGQAFPASHDWVFSVHSTDGIGNVSSFSPDEKEPMHGFALPGESIESSWPGQINKVMKSGTSFATPLAVALAANMLEYVKQKLTTMPQDLRKQLDGHSGMRLLLFSIVDREGSSKLGHHYLRPWRLFGTERSDESIQQQIELVFRNKWDRNRSTSPEVPE